MLALATGGLALFLVLMRGELRQVQEAAGAQARLSAALRTDLDAARRLVDTLTRQAADLETRVAAAESSAAQAAGLVAAVDPQRIRDEAAVLEIERLIGFAQQELQIGGSVAAAVAALQAADQRLARLQRPQLLPLRRAVTADLDRLRALPVVDIAGASLRLDQLARGVDNWTLLADPSQALAVPEPARGRGGDARPVSEGRASTMAARGEKGERPAERAGGKAQSAPSDAAGDAWRSVRAWFGSEFGDLVRIRQVAGADVLLIDPARIGLLREQIKLRLLTARQALLTRNERLFRPELSEVAGLIERYVDMRQPAVVAALAELRTLSALPLGFEVPVALDSVAAMRAVLAALPAPAVVPPAQASTAAVGKR